MSQYKTFEVKCLKCGSPDCRISIQMYDSCDIRDIICNKCGNEEDWD